jgi:hypothetical protein
MQKIWWEELFLSGSGELFECGWGRPGHTKTYRRYYLAISYPTAIPLELVILFLHILFLLLCFVFVYVYVCLLLLSHYKMAFGPHPHPNSVLMKLVLTSDSTRQVS